MYNGLFGCHVALVMRRLRRICAAVGNNDIRFVSCSATINEADKVRRSRLAIYSGKPNPHSTWRWCLASTTFTSSRKTARLADGRCVDPLINHGTQSEYAHRSTSSGIRLSSTREMSRKVA